MRYPPFIRLDGKAYRWSDVLAARRAQLEAWRKPAEQPTLFPLVEDHRPAPSRTAAGRYLQPCLFE